jgi:hypothetical protein
MSTFAVRIKCTEATILLLFLGQALEVFHKEHVAETVRCSNYSQVNDDRLNITETSSTL